MYWLDSQDSGFCITRKRKNISNKIGDFNAFMIIICETFNSLAITDYERETALP